MLEIVRFILGPVQTNSYLIADPETKQAAAIDPAWDGQVILEEARKHGWRIANIWLTHAHFDHFAGAAAVADGSMPMPPVALHPDDYTLWRAMGGAQSFGMQIDPGPEPTIDLHHGQVLYLGSSELNVRHAPGHTPGHVILYAQKENVVFCGDVIFNGSIGRTDLPGGDFDTLINSIRTQILTLPDETRLLSGHGEETTVGRERKWNYFLS
jgi:hydroxyacylglutathione hydrolase